MTMELYLAIRAILGALSLAEHAYPITLGDEPGLVRTLNLLTASFSGDLFSASMDPTQAWLHLDRMASAHPDWERWALADANHQLTSALVG